MKFTGGFDGYVDQTTRRARDERRLDEILSAEAYNESRGTRAKFHFALKALGNQFVLLDSTGNAEQRETRRILRSKVLGRAVTFASRI